MSSPVKCSGVIRVKGGQRWSEWQSILLCSCLKGAGSCRGASSLSPDLSPAEAVCSATGMLAALQIEMSLVLSLTY